jgi:hypothetical protein
VNPMNTTSNIILPFGAQKLLQAYIFYITVVTYMHWRGGSAGLGHVTRHWLCFEHQNLDFMSVPAKLFVD